MPSKMTKILLVLILTTNVVFADSIDVNLVSWHSDKAYDYNEENFGLGYTKHFNESYGLRVGYYKNSFDKLSTYFLTEYRSEFKQITLGLSLGLVTGYDNISDYDKGRTGKSKLQNLNEYQLFALPTVTYKLTKQHAIQVGFLPDIFKTTKAFATVQYQFILN